MSQHYAELNLDEVKGTEDYALATADGDTARVLGGLEPINIFVGPNNAGKSRFLRALFKAGDLHFRPSGLEGTSLSGAVRQFSDTVATILSGNLSGYGPIRRPNHFLQYAQLDWFSENSGQLDNLRKELKFLVDWNGDVSNSLYGTAGQSAPSPEQAHRAHREVLQFARPLLEKLENINVSIGHEKRIYIPVLRGLRQLGKDDVYAERTNKDYEIAVPDVFTGLSMHQRVRDLLLGTREERRLMDAYESFLSEELFERRAVEIVPLKGGDVLYFRIDGEEERAMHALGDGMQSILIMTFAAFVAEKRSLVFLEEPDTHLHPGMQRKVLELFLRSERLRRHQVFLTTHSNHLLDMGADYGGIATFLFRKTPNQQPSFRIVAVRHGERMILQELGARASSVFLTNATIWVEGITDRLYLREYLAKYLEGKGWAHALREDTHYSFMEAGGANIAHFDFEAESAVDELGDQLKLARVCSNSMVVLDGDNAGKPRLAALRAALGEGLVVLKSKEIENLLPVEVLRAYVASRLGDGSGADSVKLSDYHELSRPLGVVLDEKLGVNEFTEGQTIKRKAAVCEYCVGFMRANPGQWNLTPEAVRLCDAIAGFVAGAKWRRPAAARRLNRDSLIVPRIALHQRRSPTVPIE